MFKFERFGGFNNKKNHIVQFKTRDKTITPSILGVSTSTKKVDLFTTTSFSSSSTNNKDLFEFPTNLNTLIKPTITTENNTLEKSKVTNDKVTSTDNKNALPASTQSLPPALPTTTTTSNLIEKVDEKEKVEVKEDIDDGIFDFPDVQESSEIKLLVASSKKTQRKSKTNKKKTPSLKSSSSSDTTTTTTATKKASNSCSKASKKKSNSSFSVLSQPKGVNTQSSQPIQTQQHVEQNALFDIFDFDFNPTVKIRHKSANDEIYNYAPPPPLPPQQQQQQQQQQQYYTPNLQPTPIIYNYNTPSSIPSYNNNNPVFQNNQTLIPVSYPQQFNRNPMMSIDSILLNDPVAFQQVNDFLNETPAPTPTPAPPSQPLANISNTQPPKRRKRNLVAHLKSASGETTGANKGYDFLSDEEESIQLNSENSDIVPFREFIQKERSTSPELTYNERMELELEVMMKSEFGKKETDIDKEVQQDKQQQQQQQRRPRYQPQNKLNVKVTFEKKKQ